MYPSEHKHTYIADTAFLLYMFQEGQPIWQLPFTCINTAWQCSGSTAVLQAPCLQYAKSSLQVRGPLQPQESHPTVSDNGKL
ncbi:hypothetical protein XELAEV_18013855mg [Xenopus laevis]|uniref:Uncharacterized protein n=1 Tax=Xenopus laevis TaxID=8355 RepID=A0A974DSE6_XENLA|nr:hypothetical protein XELAEV_18013855mg [Xenopus laevis]